MFDHQHLYCESNKCQQRNERGMLRYFLSQAWYTLLHKTEIRHYFCEGMTTKLLMVLRFREFPLRGENRLKILFYTRLRQSYGLGTVNARPAIVSS
jgi:hypothetical protein